MSIDIQTLTDAIIAVLTTVGVAVAVTIAFVVAGLFSRRGPAPAERVAVQAGPPQQPTQPDDARTLVLR
ncbi:MAG TPA: hypothetical protein VEJ42_01620 [Streptosporangiaceae bacterium]|nr:hypothetical protein [Streptosporangiaceae bacterium]